MSSFILDFILGTAADEIWNLIKDHLFKPDPNGVDAILGGQRRIESLIIDLDYKQQIREPLDSIYYWTKRMQEVVADLNRTNNSPESVRAYEELLSALRSENNGVRRQTYTLFVAVMGDNSPLGKDGLLAHWEEQTYKKLADVTDTKFFMHDYAKELDTNIAAVIALLHHALSLSFFVASDAVDATNLKDECITRVKTFRDTLFQAYPPALRQFKPGGYDDTSGFYLTGMTNIGLPLQRWFHLYKEDDATRRTFLTINNFWIRELSATGPSGAGAPIRAFRFVMDKTTAPMGAMQLHAYWLSSQDNNSLVKFYDYSPPGTGRTYAYTNSLRSGTTYPILFKLIPLAVNESNTTRTPVRLVPFHVDSLLPSRQDANNTFGTIFKLELTNNPT